MQIQPTDEGWTYAVELAQSLAPHGTEVALVTTGCNPSRVQRRDIKSLSHLTLHSVATGDASQEMNRLREVEEWFAPDAIHLNNFTLPTARFESPTLLVLHGEHRLDGKPEADAVVFTSHAAMREGEQNLGATPARVIFNGLDPARFKPSQKEKLIFTPVVPGTDHVEGKVLEEVAPKISWPVCVTSASRRIARLAQKVPGLRWLGRLGSDALPAWCGRASIFLQAGYNEPFGLTAVAAGLAGCALVLSDSPSLRELWAGAAVFVAPGDARSLRVALRRLMENPARLKELAVFAQCRAIQLNSQQMATQYLGAYAEAMNRRAVKAIP